MIEILKQRRSIRKYLDKKVEKEKLEVLKKEFFWPFFEQ